MPEPPFEGTHRNTHEVEEAIRNPAGIHQSPGEEEKRNGKEEEIVDFRKGEASDHDRDPLVGEVPEKVRGTNCRNDSRPESHRYADDDKHDESEREDCVDDHGFSPTAFPSLRDRIARAFSKISKIM